jgi:hypothetical protein
VGALDLDCGTCPCTATVDCQGALDLYTGGTNTGCTGTAFSVATGTCKSVPAGTTFGSYEWAPSATQSPVGTVGDATGVSVSLATSSEATVCCQ